MALRIIAGSARGRTLATPRGKDTRPTSDRVREAMFSIVGSAMDLGGARVLDLFAGSGALGLEALSRGASAAVFVDRSRRCQQVILDNARALGFDGRCRVLPDDVARAAAALQRQGESFGLVLADPPYADPVEPLLELVAGSGVVADGGRLVLEHAGRKVPAGTPDGLVLEVRRRYGDTALSVYARKLVLDDGGDSAYKRPQD